MSHDVVVLDAGGSSCRLGLANDLNSLKYETDIQ